ncbi:MAG: hypothetical protein M3277_05430 [Actinomycetota bacterium]|nr:hypothetical protein [Actinomycetota bacterium]
MKTDTESSSRMIWVLFLAGPVIWFVHFMAVYVLAEAVCAAGDGGPRLLGLSLLALVTLVATVLAVGAALVFAVRAYRVWRGRTDGSSDWLAGDERNGGLALAGWLLGSVFVVAILFVGLPAAFLDPC